MSEQLTLDCVVLTPHELAAMQEVGEKAIRTVDKAYGTGYPNFENGANGGLAYHNGFHSRSVARDSGLMGRYLGMTTTEVVTAEEAGAAHDIVQLKPRGAMERESADWYAEQLRRRRLPEVVIEAGSLAILGTEPLFDEQFRLVGQKVSELEFPSRSAEMVAQTVASADFGGLYGRLGPYLGHRLWQQIKGCAPNATPPMEGLIAFQKGQVFLVNTYRYPHSAGEKVFGRLRVPVVEHHEAMLRRLEAGQIASWQQLLDDDLAFAVRFS